MLIQNVMSFDDFLNYVNNYKFIIINISAKWCKPCVALKPPLEKFINVINETDFVYLKLDNSIYDEEQEFHKYFILKGIPYFSFIKEGNIIDSFINGDFNFVSKKIFNFVSSQRNKINDNET
jgi:thioredoxin-like negative regulator of GroEL